MEEPDERISSTDALEHPFFTQHVLKPSLSDLVLLPSSVLQLINVVDSNNEAGDVQGKLLHEEELIEKNFMDYILLSILELFFSILPRKKNKMSRLSYHSNSSLQIQ